MNQLIEKSKQLTNLLIEYREAQKYESCLYHLIKQPDQKDYFWLYLIETQQIIREGAPQRIRGYLEARKIDPSTVYQLEILPKQANI